MRLSPMQTGLALSAGLTAAVAVGFGFGTARYLDPPSPELFRQLAQVGLGLFIAYSVALSSIVKGFVEATKDAPDQSWLGYLVGVGLCGLLAVGFGLALAEHRQAGHANRLDDFGLGWIIGSIMMLGGVVAFLPVIHGEWRHSDDERDLEA